MFVFLSEYEGFGLTPLEALSAGVPIVVNDTPVAREVYGDAAWYVADATDVRGATARHRQPARRSDAPATRMLAARARDARRAIRGTPPRHETLAAMERVGAPT